MNKTMDKAKNELKEVAIAAAPEAMKAIDHAKKAAEYGSKAIDKATEEALNRVDNMQVPTRFMLFLVWWRD